MIHGPFRFFIPEVKHTLWGRRLQIYYLSFLWLPILCASKQGHLEKYVLAVCSNYYLANCAVVKKTKNKKKHTYRSSHDSVIFNMIWSYKTEHVQSAVYYKALLLMFVPSFCAQH